MPAMRGRTGRKWKAIFAGFSARVKNNLHQLSSGRFLRGSFLLYPITGGRVCKIGHGLLLACAP